MGILADYNDESFATRCNFRPPNWVSEPLLMLPIPTDQVATQECVGDNAMGPRLANARPSEKGRFTAKVAARNIQEVPGGNIQEIPGYRSRVAARNIQEIPGCNIQEIPGGNIQEIPGYQSRVTYKKYLHQVSWVELTSTNQNGERSCVEPRNL